MTIHFLSGESGERFINIAGRSNWVDGIMWSRPVASSSCDHDLDVGYAGHKVSRLADHTSQLVMGRIVIAVDLVYSLKAAFVYHGLGSPWVFFCRLEEQSDYLGFGDLVPVLH